MKLSGSLRTRVQAIHVFRPRITRPSAVTPRTQAACPSCNSHRAIASSAASRRAVSSSLNFNAAQDDRDERVVRMLMFGKPGAGKGTLSALLTKKYDILSISTGDLLRQHIAEGTEVGKQAEKIVAQGALLPDELMLKVVTSKLDALHNKHWIVDGFPRTVNQGKLLSTHLTKRNSPLTLVVNLNVPDEVILGRISDRWVHLPSGRVYNSTYNPARVTGFDDVTGEPLTKRPDDNPEIFARRLQAFYSTTSPLLKYYEALASESVSPPPNPYQHPHQLSVHRPPRIALRTLTGNTSDEIWPELDYIMVSMFPGLKKRSELATTRQTGLHRAMVADSLESTASFK